MNVNGKLTSDNDWYWKYKEPVIRWYCDLSMVTSGLYKSPVIVPVGELHDVDKGQIDDPLATWHCNVLQINMKLVGMTKLGSFKHMEKLDARRKSGALNIVKAALVLIWTAPPTYVNETSVTTCKDGLLSNQMSAPT